MAEWFGRSLKYTGDKCPNCGRIRVELYENGKRVCEKCQWCIEDEEYVDTGEWWEEEQYCASYGRLLDREGKRNEDT